MYIKNVYLIAVAGSFDYIFILNNSPKYTLCSCRSEIKLRVIEIKIWKISKSEYFFTKLNRLNGFAD